MNKLALYLGALTCAIVAVWLLASGEAEQAQAVGVVGLAFAAIYELS